MNSTTTDSPPRIRPFPRLLPVLLAALCWIGGCGNNPSAPPAARPRVVAFSPGLTRMLFDMGLGDHVVGVTPFAILPPGETRPVVGDTLNFRVEPVLAVEPEVILTQVDPRIFEPLVRLRPDIRVEHFDVETLTDIGAAMARLGRIVGQEAVGLAAQADFLQQLDAVRRLTADRDRPGVLFVIGYENPLGAGAGTFHDEMISVAGGVNVLADVFQGWKTLTLETVLNRRPDVIVCQCKPHEEDTAAAYWRNWGDFDKRVYTVTDKTWTIPAGYFADYATDLAAMIHPAAVAAD